MLRGGEIRNATQSAIRDVRATHEPTRRTVFASQILPGRAFELQFSPRELQSTHAELTWTDASGRACSARLAIPGCPSELADRPIRVVYTIQGNGTANVELAPADR
jgi:hypothetical protein